MATNRGGTLEHKSCINTFSVFLFSLLTFRNRSPNLFCGILHLRLLRHFAQRHPVTLSRIDHLDISIFQHSIVRHRRLASSGHTYSYVYASSTLWKFFCSSVFDIFASRLLRNSVQIGTFIGALQVQCFFLLLFFYFYSTISILTPLCI